MLVEAAGKDLVGQMEAEEPEEPSEASQVCGTHLVPRPKL